MPSKGRLSLGDVTHLVGAILLGTGFALAVCAITGFGFRDGSFAPLGISAALTLAAGGLARGFTHVPEDVNFREAFATVTFAWVAVATAGALPYLFSGVIPDPAAALFESMSGFTTTGSTVLEDIEAVPPGLLLWRSATQWLGGMGIIVLGVAILPYLGVGGMQLFRLESPGPTHDRLRPRIRDTAKLLWWVYGVLTAACILLYLLGGMTVFEAVNHAFTTLPTGGFSSRNASLADFNPFVQWVAIIFMYLAGMSFALHYRVLSRGPRAYWRDTEWRLYTGFILIPSLLVALWLVMDGSPLELAVRDGVFQVTSIMTTTGYATADYVLWAPSLQVLLLLLMFIGGMAGSTAGAMKTVRVLLVLKHVGLELRKQLHPRAVLVPKIGGLGVREPVLLNVLGFVFLYMIIFGIGTFLLAGLGLSMPGAAGAAATSLGNVGPGLAELGPVENFGFLSGQSQLILTALMLLGRLEIYTVLLLFHPRFWAHR
ncbi:MAG: TrkH family potassium uptake protein [Longimicrobiaceae bacterium]